MSGRDHRLSLYEGTPGPDGFPVPSSGVWFVYAARGEATVGSGERTATLGPDDGAFVRPGERIRSDTLCWFYEVAPRSAAVPAELDLLRSQVLTLGLGPPFLVRGDRIELPAGAVTPRHGHRGPGIRRLVFGQLMAEVGDATERIDAGHSWFETGHDMVVGRPLGGSAAFVRVMVLPMELEGGKSSFMPADEAEAAKPRSVHSRLFGETVLDPQANGRA